MTSAAGLAMGGLHPVVAIYSTFLNRAFDQIMMDVALHKLPVTLVLDRSGVTGPDGASHNGMWDLSMLNVVPGMRVAAPRDAARLYEELGEALEVTDGPTALRFPKGDVGEDIPALDRRDGIDVLAVPARRPVRRCAVGRDRTVRGDGESVAEQLRNQGVGVTVIDPRSGSTVPETIGALAKVHELVVTFEDNGVTAASALRCRPRCDVPRSTCRADVRAPQEFRPHASRGEGAFADVGQPTRNITHQVTGWVAALGSA